MFTVIIIFAIVHVTLAQEVNNVKWKTYNDGSCYLKVTEKLGWDDAKKYCEKRSARLITFPVIDKDGKKISEVFYDGGK
jgi:hypothetical protein